MPGVRVRDGDASATHVVSVTVGEILRGPGVDDAFRPVRVVFEPKDNSLPFMAIGKGLPLLDLVSSTTTGLDQAFAIIARERELLSATDAEVMEQLSHPEVQLRDFAIQLLGERKSRAAVPALCARLTQEPSTELVLRLVGSLVAIRDPAAAEPLIDLARNRSPEIVIQIAYALGALGGPTAEGYLVTLASGHPAEAVRDAAEAALKDLAFAHRAKKPDLTPSQR